MARGFDSKDIEFQQAEATRPPSPRRMLTPAERAVEDRRRTIEPGVILQSCSACGSYRVYQSDLIDNHTLRRTCVHRSHQSRRRSALGGRCGQLGARNISRSLTRPSTVLGEFSCPTITIHGRC